MCAALLTEPVSPGSDAGVIFLQNDGYSAISGHGIIAVATIAPALDGVEVAYYLAHSMGAGERGFAERDRQAARNFAMAAARAGIARIIYLGGLGDDAADLSHHLASRHEAGAELAAHGVPVTEFRAAVIIGSGSAVSATCSTTS